MKKLIIIGSGFGGISVLTNLKKLCGSKKEFDILLISNTEHFLFTPLLHEAIVDEVKIDHIILKIKDIQKKLGNFDFLNKEVKNIDFDNKKVILDGQSIDYDYLVISAGSQSNIFNHKKEDLFLLKDFNDYGKLRNRLKIVDFNRLSIVGAGATGVELLGSLTDFFRKNNKKVEIFLFEGNNKVLPELNNDYLSNVALERLEELGAKVNLNTYVQELKKDYIVAYDKQKKEVINLSTDFIVWVAGIKPSTLVETIDLPKNNGKIITDNYLNVEKYPEVYALGDCISINSENTITTAQSAVQQAYIVSYNLYAKNHLFKFSKKYNYNHQGSLISIGNGFAISDIFGISFTGYSGWFIWKAIHLFKLDNNKNRKQVLFDWIENVSF
ncbi:MAG: FAD-dependent oxidoreductase [Candidatus Sericytochromatia bacterium]